MEQSLEQMKLKYQLECQLSALKQELAAKKEAANYALYEKRQTEAQAAEYRGSLKSLLHGLSGTRAETQEQYARAARDAAARVQQAKADQTRLEQQLQETQEALESLPEIEPQDSPEWARGAARIKGEYLLKTTLPLTEETISALETARDWEQPKLRYGIQQTAQTRYGCQEMANNLAKNVRRNVEELNECLTMLGMPTVELGPYFYGPEAYLVTAFQYGTLDQMNKAMDQLYACRKALTALRGKFE